MKKAAMKSSAMKMKKAMKSSAMKMKKAMRVSKIAKGRLAKVVVFRGSKAKTVGGLTKDKLTKNKNGRVVSKAQSAQGKKSPWMRAVAGARKALGIKGFQIIGGKTAKGQTLLKKARSMYKK